MYKKIKNPKTGNYLNINSKIGKSILKKYLGIFIKNYSGGRPDGIREGIHSDNGAQYTFNYYKTIEDANSDNLIGEIADLGELPEEAWFTNNDGILYKVIEYQGNIDRMICRRLGEQDKLFYLDPFLLKVKYWGYMDNVPPLYKNEKEMRMDDEDDPFDFMESDEDLQYLNENIGTELNIGSLPLKSWITYQDHLLQIIHYDNFGIFDLQTGNKGILCHPYQSEIFEYIDSTDDAIYWGDINNVPLEFKI